MGNSPNNGDLTSCLLSKAEFNKLRVNDRFDHRDYEGRFVEAIVLETGRQKVNYVSERFVKIHYVGWSEKYDVWDSYAEHPYSFAKHGAVTGRQALSHNFCEIPAVGSLVSFRAPGQGRWSKAKIVKRDPESAQVRVQYGGKNDVRWTHLDNHKEIRPFSSSNSSKSKNHHKHRHSHQHRHDGQNQQYGAWPSRQQKQKQMQMQRQDQMTVRTQLLLDDTHKQIQLTRNYLKAAATQNVDKEELSVFNQKVVVGLTCFKMKISGMRKNAKKEGLDFDGAFKGSQVIIQQFEEECQEQFGHNKSLMKRLKPILNYMYAILLGMEDIPALPYVDEYEFNEQTASSVISAVNHAQNHVIPDRMKEINENNKQYKTYHGQLKQRSKNKKKKPVAQKIEFNDLIQDYHTENIAFGQSKQQQDAIIAQQQEQYRFQEPDLMNVDGDDDSSEMLFNNL